MPVAQALWTAGKSQPDACDPVFAWLKKQDGITSGLAWERFSLAITARERSLARYVIRFMNAGDRAWAERWVEQDRGGYRQLSRAARWPQGEQARPPPVLGHQLDHGILAPHEAVGEEQDQAQGVRVTGHLINLKLVASRLVIR